MSTDTSNITPARVEAPHGLGVAQLSLALGGFAIGTAEFAAMGLLPETAHDLHISIPSAGNLISAYALGVVVGAPLITVVLAKLPRRAMLIGLMALYALGNTATAMFHSYGWVLLFRFISGLPHGAYFGLAALAAASLAPPGKRGSAIARVMLGLSVANVIGVPMATWLGQTAGWRACFLAVGGIAALAALMITYAVPGLPSSTKASPLRELGALRRPKVLLTLLAGAIGFGGLFSVYSYVSATLVHVTHVSDHFVPWALALIGVGMIAGNTLCGWLTDRWIKQTMFGMYVFTGVILFAFSLLASNLFFALAILFGVGIGTAVTTAFQSRLIDVAGDAQSLAASLNHSAFNIANALGAWLGGLGISAGLGWASTGWIGGVLAMMGTLILLLSFRGEWQT